MNSICVVMFLIGILVIAIGLTAIHWAASAVFIGFVLVAMSITSYKK